VVIERSGVENCYVEQCYAEHSFVTLDQALPKIIALLGEGKVVALIGLNNTDLTAGASAIGEVNNAGFSSAEQTKNTISFDHTFTQYQSVSGIASLLLSSESFTLKQPTNVYAWLTGVAFTEIPQQYFHVKQGSDPKKHIEVTVSQALTAAKLSAHQIGLLEVSALAEQSTTQEESTALLHCYHGSPLTTAITSARSITGEGAGFSQVIGLLRTVIALQQSYIPSMPDWEKPTDQQTALWQSSNFYCPTEARPWYANRSDAASGNNVRINAITEVEQRHAAYSCLTEQGYSHLVLSEFTDTCAISGNRAVKPNGFLASSTLKLMLVSANSESELTKNLGQLQLQLKLQQAVSKNNDDLSAIAIQQYQIFLSAVNSTNNTNKKYTLSLLSDSAQALLSEIQLAVIGIKCVFSTELTTVNEWKTPKGSYFTAKPVTSNKRVSTGASTNTKTTNSGNNVCFMYPGIGATYVGLGRDLFHMFPEIYPTLLNLTDDLSLTLKDKLLNPRSISKLSFDELKQGELSLRASLPDIAEAGVGFACVFTHIFEQVFKIKADFATGYSMGEVSMYAALGCWQQPGLMSERLINSSTFTQHLCGDLLTLREHWQLDAAKNTKQSERIWETYTIKATLAEVEQASIDEPRVYCTIINTPDSVVLAGYPAACLRVIKTLGIRAMPLNMANAIHSPPAKLEYNSMVELYTMAVNQRIDTKMYSSSCYLPIPQLSKTIAHSIAKCLCERVDFPRLINTLYEQGARIFIEMGPGRSLSSWVDKIIEPRRASAGSMESDNNENANTHVSVPVNAKGTNDELTYFRALAKLTSQGVKVDLNSLFYGSIVMPKKMNNAPNLTAIIPEITHRGSSA
jgi:PfaB family protein